MDNDGDPNCIYFSHGTEKTTLARTCDLTLIYIYVIIRRLQNIIFMLYHLKKIVAKMLYFTRNLKLVNFIIVLVQDLGLKKFMGALAGGILVGVIIFSVAFSPKTPEELPQSNGKPVTLKTVNDLSVENDSLSLIGTVTSVHEATVYTEASGIITHLSYTLGDAIPRGAVLAEIENSHERALVLSARATLEQVESGYARDLTDVYAQASQAYQQAFTRASDAVFGKTDAFFSAPRTSAPQLNISSFGDSTLEKDRARINDILSLWEGKLSSIYASEDIVNLLEEAHRDTYFIKLFLDHLATIVNRQTPGTPQTEATLEAEKSALFSARSNVDASLLAITSAINELSQTLPKNSGGTGESEAKIAIAEASLASALSTLQKTIMRAPISGTINALDIKVGDFVNTFTPVATIANNEMLEIVTFISPEDKDHIVHGNVVEIEGGGYGVVTKVAPALNPTTKKIEVRIAVNDDDTALINGSTVRIVILPTLSDGPVTAKAEIHIPLEALKLENGGAYVFSVDETTHKLQGHSVSLNQITGNSVSVSGIDKTLLIVTDARGLSEGEQVEVTQK